MLINAVIVLAAIGTGHADTGHKWCEALEHCPRTASSDVNGVVGIYPVSGGQVIVWSDRSAKYYPLAPECQSAYAGKRGEDATAVECFE